VATPRSERPGLPRLRKRGSLAGAALDTGPEDHLCLVAVVLPDLEHAVATEVAQAPAGNEVGHQLVVHLRRPVLGMGAHDQQRILRGVASVVVEIDVGEDVGGVVLVLQPPQDPEFAAREVGSPSGAASGIGRLKLVRAKLEYFDWPPHPL
jgi:hypothetical protein